MFLFLDLQTIFLALSLINNRLYLLLEKVDIRRFLKMTRKITLVTR